MVSPTPLTPLLIVAPHPICCADQHQAPLHRQAGVVRPSPASHPGCAAAQPPIQGAGPAALLVLRADLETSAAVGAVAAPQVAAAVVVVGWGPWALRRDQPPLGPAVWLPGHSTHSGPNWVATLLDPV